MDFLMIYNNVLVGISIVLICICSYLVYKKRKDLKQTK